MEKLATQQEQKDRKEEEKETFDYEAYNMELERVEETIAESVAMGIKEAFAASEEEKKRRNEGKMKAARFESKLEQRKRQWDIDEGEEEEEEEEKEEPEQKKPKDKGKEKVSYSPLCASTTTTRSVMASKKTGKALPPPPKWIAT